MNEDLIIVIPAKGVSKRLPRKNMLTLGGEPLVKIAVDRAISSKLGKTVVSTEDENIIEYLQAMIGNDVAKYKDLEISRRPDYLAEDNARAWQVCLNVGEYYNARTIMMTLPTSPFARVGDLILALNMFVDNNRMPVMSITEVKFNPETLIKRFDDDVLYPYDTDYGLTWKHGIARSKRKIFLSNGAVWICDTKMLAEKKESYIDGMIGYEMPQERSFDINTEFDYIIACALVGGEKFSLMLDRLQM